MVAPNDDQVRYDILIEAKAALKSLQELLRMTEDNREKIIRFSQVVVAHSKAWGVSWQQALNVYKQLNAELSKNKKANIFGNVGGQDLFKQSAQYMSSLEQAGRLQEEVGTKGKKMGTDIEEGSRRAVRGIDVIRIALGALVAMLIFNVIQAIQNTFREMIGNLREAELAVYNLINAERRLSEMGIDVTPKGLQEIIDSVRELVPVLSQIQAEELVSRIATNVAPALKLTNEQIKQMAEATALLYIRNKALGKSFDEVESQLTNAFLTGKVSVGINNLGVKISDQIVKDEALRMGLVKTEEEFNNLTGEIESQIKAAAMLSVVYKNATGDIESIGEYMQTTDAALDQAKTKWSDLLTILGQFSAPALIQSLTFIIGILQAWIEILTWLKPVIADFVAITVAGFQMIGYAITHPNETLADFANKFLEMRQGIFTGLMTEFADAVDTPTAAIEDLQSTIDNFDAEEFGNKIEDIIEDLENAREDLAEKFQQKQDDIDLEYLRKAEDAERDYLRKVEDINRDAERDLAALREEHRQEDAQAEAEYQNQLWELRMRFLMDLEEALHARDARQVIRLQKQYEIDKEALERKQNLEDEQREQDQQNEIEDIELRRQQRLEDAQLEYQQKLYDQQLAKQRELDDLNVWYAREQADLEQATQRKLETLIKGWIDEKKITEQNAAEVYGILAKYFGPGGMTDALYQYMMQSLIAASSIPIGYVSAYGSLGGGIGGGSNTESLSGGNAGGASGGRQMAEGGTLLATRPTTVTFGEAGDELATFTPLNRIGRNVGKLFGDLSSGSRDGQIVLDITLSPDLEARIIENSMDGVGEIIARVNRSKV